MSAPSRSTPRLAGSGRRMSKAPFVVGATLAGSACLLMFHPGAGPASTSGFLTPGTQGPGRSVTSSTSAAGAAPNPAGSAPPQNGSTTANSKTASPAPGASSPSTTAPAPTTTQAPATTTTTPGHKTAAGNVTQYPYGVLQVTATVSGGQITQISYQVQSSDGRSQAIELFTPATASAGAQRAEFVYPGSFGRHLHLPSLHQLAAECAQFAGLCLSDRGRRTSRAL